MYKLVKCSPTEIDRTSIFRIIDSMSIPFNLSNSDYVRFKKEINEGKAELQDAEGNTMTTEEVEEFVATLP
jgi:hypothetical protein